MSASSVSIPGAINGGTIGCNDQSSITAGTLIWKIPARVGSVGLQEYITSTSASYNVYATMNTIDMVEAGTAHWFDLFGAAQTSSRQHSVMPSVTAIKIVVASGTVECAIRGQ